MTTAHLNAAAGRDVQPGETFHTMCGIDHTSENGTIGSKDLPICVECLTRSSDYATGQITALARHNRRLLRIIDNLTSEVELALDQARDEMQDNAERYGVTLPTPEEES